MKQLKLEKYNEEDFPVDEGLIEFIPFDVSQRYQVLPLKKKGRLLTIAMVDPLDIGAMDAIEVLTDSEVEPVVCTEAELNHMVSTLYGAESGISSVLDGVDSDSDDESGVEVVEDDDEDVKVESLQEMAGEATIVRLVNSIFDQAIRDGASDIHVCPQQNSVQLRFR